MQRDRVESVLLEDGIDGALKCRGTLMALLNAEGSGSFLVESVLLEDGID
jgi:hypothetical protein